MKKDKKLVTLKPGVQPSLVMYGDLTEVEATGQYQFDVGGVPLCLAIDDVVKATRNMVGQATYGKVTLAITFHEAEAR
jgi:hypothetical protein